MALNPEVLNQPDPELGNVSSAKPAAGTGDEPKEYATKEELQVGFDQIQKNLERFTQGLVDTNMGRVNQVVRDAVKSTDEFIAMQEDAGVTLTEAQKSNMRNMATLKAMQQKPAEEPKEKPPVEPQGDQPKGQPATESQGYPEGYNPITATAIRMMQDAGIQVGPEDKEWATIDQATKEVKVFIDSVDKAIGEKRARMNRPKGADESVPGAITTGGAAPNLQANYEKELESYRGNPAKIQEIEDKYRDLGLQT